MEFETSRLRVRKAKESDASPLFTNYCGSVAASKFLARYPHTDEQATLNSIRHWQSLYEEPTPEMHVLVVEELKASEAIGCLVLKFENDLAEIHFGISTQFSGLGLATEMCQGAVKLLCDRGIARIWTYPHVDNVASIKVFERCGFRRKSILENWLLFPNLSAQKQDCLEMRYEAA